MKRKVLEGEAETQVARDPGHGEEHAGRASKERALRQECCAEGDSSWQERYCKDKIRELWSQEEAD